MTLPKLPVELRLLLLETTAALPQLKSSSGQVERPLIALASTHASLYAVFKANQARLLRIAFKTQAGDAFELANKLQSREEEHDNAGSSSSEEVGRLRRMLARHMHVSYFAEYIDKRDCDYFEYFSRLNFREYYGKKLMEYWQRAVYMYALYGAKNEDYPPPEHGEKHFDGWRHITYYESVHGEPINLLRKEIIMRDRSTDKYYEFQHWFLGFEAESMKNTMRWKLLARLIGIWDGVDMAKQGGHIGSDLVRIRDYRFSEPVLDRRAELLKLYDEWEYVLQR